MDIAGALCGILLRSPIMLTTFVVLTITTRGKAVFVQERIGYRGRRFMMCKFRTMRLDAQFTTHFIGRLKGCDSESAPRTDASGNPIAATRKYSTDVGPLLATVKGRSPSYK